MSDFPEAENSAQIRQLTKTFNKIRPAGIRLRAGGFVLWWNTPHGVSDHGVAKRQTVIRMTGIRPRE